MVPTIALVGRPNVGKSTIFNRLTRSRDALVADVPGLTRDRRYGRAVVEEQPCVLIDTGGLFGDSDLQSALTEQTRLAVTEADLVVLVLDARDGANAADYDVVRFLRTCNVPTIAVINKIDGINEGVGLSEFAHFGFADPVMVSAAHNRGLGQLRERLGEELQACLGDRVGSGLDAESGVEETGDVDDRIAVAIVGRPNVGKSTLVNRFLGEERQVVFDRPGTTMDAIDIPFDRDDKSYLLIDTAGVRRKGRVDEVAEKFSVVKALAAMERASVVILVLDAREGVVEQDLHVLKYAADAGAGLVIALNKWDGLSGEVRERAKRSVTRRLDFVPWAPVRFISALHGTGVGHLLHEVDAVHAAGRFDVSTSRLTRLLGALVDAHPPPAPRGRPVKLKVAHPGGGHPPTVVIHGNQVDALPASYVRYLENGFREALNLVGNPVRIQLKRADNPYAGKRNPLTRRQQKRRKRVIHASRR